MKKIIGFCIGILMVFGFAADAFAFMQNDILYSSKYDANNLWMSPRMEKGTNLCNFTLELQQDVNTSEWLITDAFLVLSFKDDGGKYDFFEFANVFDGYERSYFEVDTGNYVIPISNDGITALNKDGSLAFTLTRLMGDFSFCSAQLIALAEPSPMPLPSSVLLFVPMLSALLILRKRLAL